MQLTTDLERDEDLIEVSVEFDEDLDVSSVKRIDNGADVALEGREEKMLKALAEEQAAKDREADALEAAIQNQEWERAEW